MPVETSDSSNRTPLLRLWYGLVRMVFSAVLITTCGIRASGRRNVPATGATMMMANHASFYDTIILGVAQRRMIDFMARSGLFIPILGPFISSMGAFPIQRDGGGATGIKETLKRLKNARLIGLFPEGTRTPDGTLQPLRPGIANIARKSGCQILCVAIYGAFEAWPRSQPWPGSWQFHVHYEPPITPADLAGKTDDEAMGMMRQKLELALGHARASVDRLRDYRMF
ncbi:MAG: lysophospholipid acyltransferase family protein [bacterium]